MEHGEVNAITELANDASPSDSQIGRLLSRAWLVRGRLERLIAHSDRCAISLDDLCFAASQPVPPAAAPGERAAGLVRRGLRYCAMPCLTIDTPTGPITLTEAQGAIVRAEWGGAGDDHTALLDRAAADLRGYFNDPAWRITVPLRVAGSAFQRAVCDAIRAIPVGRTRTYGEIARDLGASPQAVGQACGGNPIPILIPCHRVLGADGLGGFSGTGGVETKVALLRHEGAAGLLI